MKLNYLHVFNVITDFCDVISVFMAESMLSLYEILQYANLLIKKFAKLPLPSKTQVLHLSWNPDNDIHSTCMCGP